MTGAYTVASSGYATTRSRSILLRKSHAPFRPTPFRPVDRRRRARGGRPRRAVGRLRRTLLGARRRLEYDHHLSLPLRVQLRAKVHDLVLCTAKDAFFSRGDGHAMTPKIKKISAAVCERELGTGRGTRTHGSARCE
eukprot:4714855-Prymnesium_polylepis.1